MSVSSLVPKSRPLTEPRAPVRKDELELATAEQRMEWALANLPGTFVLSSSFGIQSAVLLHLVSKRPVIPS